MESLVDSGRCRAIGLSDIGLNELLPIYESARIKPAVVQVEAHPYLPETQLLEFCKQKDIVFLAFAPLYARPHELGRRERPVTPGSLRSRGIRDAWHLEGCSPAAASARGSPWSRPNGLLRAEWSQRAMESCTPKPAGICRGLRRSREVGVSHGSLPYVRVRIDRRVGAVRPGAARSPGGRECADLLLPPGDAGGAGSLKREAAEANWPG